MQNPRSSIDTEPGTTADEGKARATQTSTAKSCRDLKEEIDAKFDELWYHVDFGRTVNADPDSIPFSYQAFLLILDEINELRAKVKGALCGNDP